MTIHCDNKSGPKNCKKILVPEIFSTSELNWDVVGVNGLLLNKIICMKLKQYLEREALVFARVAVLK